jgi:hypothetical protein
MHMSVDQPRENQMILQVESCVGGGHARFSAYLENPAFIEGDAAVHYRLLKVSFSICQDGIDYQLS